jgi:hypothetical protein
MPISEVELVHSDV